MMVPKTRKIDENMYRREYVLHERGRGDKANLLVIDKEYDNSSMHEI